MPSPKISVIVPVYKVEKYLNKCVDSIVKQTFTDTEIILVDDGSPDNCGKMCDDWSQRDSRIRVIHKENGGLSDARNRGIQESSGEYIIFIDSDDFIEPKMLEVLYGLATENDADVSVCGIFNCYKSKKTPQCEMLEKYVFSGVEALKEYFIGKRIPGGVVTRLIKTDIAKKLEFLYGKTYEDAYYSPKLFLTAKKVAVDTTPLYNYWHRADSITSMAFTEKAMDVVDAYERAYDTVRENCPQIIDCAEFRVQWANFVVLDRMMLIKDYKKIPQYKGVVKYLKKHWLSIAKSKYFRNSRKVSAIALKFSVDLYRILSNANSHKKADND